MTQGASNTDNNKEGWRLAFDITGKVFYLALVWIVGMCVINSLTVIMMGLEPFAGQSTSVDVGLGLVAKIIARFHFLFVISLTVTGLGAAIGLLHYRARIKAEKINLLLRGEVLRLEAEVEQLKRQALPVAKVAP